MGAEETTEVLHRVYAAYAAADVPTIDALNSADCVMHVPGHHPMSDDYVGKEAILHIWHLRHGQLSEFWDTSFDQAAEDACWMSVAST